MKLDQIGEEGLSAFTAGSAVAIVVLALLACAVRLIFY